MRSLLRILLAALLLPGIAALVASLPARAADDPARVHGWSSAELSTVPGQRVTLAPKVSMHGRPAAGRMVVLQQRTADGTWRAVDRARTDAKGHARLAFTAPSTVGRGVLRIRSGAATSAIRAVSTTATVSSTASTAAPTVADAFRADVLTLTNSARGQARSCGLKAFPAAGPLTRNADLDRAAQAYADQMQAQGFFDHASPDGSTMTSRAEAVGYTSWRALAENIASGQSTPQQVVDAWLASPGHCANLMNAQLSDLGVGYAERSSTWVQDFGRR